MYSSSNQNPLEKVDKMDSLKNVLTALAIAGYLEHGRRLSILMAAKYLALNDHLGNKVSRDPYNLLLQELSNKE